MEKFNNCIIVYRSGGNSSYIIRVKDLSGKQIECTVSEAEQLEKEHQEIIELYKTDAKAGYGELVIIDGLKVRFDYDNQG